MSAVVELVCSDGRVQVPRNIIWRVSQLVRDMFHAEADVDRVPLPRFTAEAVRCMFTAFENFMSTGEVSLTTADSLKALVVADFLQAEGMLQLLRSRLQTAKDLAPLLLEFFDVVPASTLSLPVIQFLLESHKQDERFISRVLGWTCRGHSDFAAGLKCDLTLTEDSDLDFARLGRLVINGPAFGTVRVIYLLQRYRYIMYLCWLPNWFGTVQIQPWQLSGSRTVPWRGVVWWQRALYLSGKTSPALPFLQDYNDLMLNEREYNSPRNIEIAADCCVLLIDGAATVRMVQGPTTVTATTVLLYSVGSAAVSSFASAA